MHGRRTAPDRGSQQLFADVVGHPETAPEGIESRAAVANARNEGEGGAALSPDGRWLAYTFNGTGRNEIWVAPYPGLSAPVRVSANGGADPVWAKNGRELYYLEGQRVMSVAVQTAAASPFGRATMLFESSYGPAQLPNASVSCSGGWTIPHDAKGAMPRRRRRPVGPLRSQLGRRNGQLVGLGRLQPKHTDSVPLMPPGLAQALALVFISQLWRWCALESAPSNPCPAPSIRMNDAGTPASSAPCGHCRTTRNDPGRGPGCTVHPGPTVAVQPSPFSVVASTTTGAGSEIVSSSAETSAPPCASKNPHAPLFAIARKTVPAPGMTVAPMLLMLPLPGSRHDEHRPIDVAAAQLGDDRLLLAIALLFGSPQRRAVIARSGGGRVRRRSHASRC